MGFNPFDTQEYDLGISIYTNGADKDYVDSTFRTAHMESSLKCIYCGGTATHKLIARVPGLDSEQLRKQGFICENCIKQKVVSPSDYGIREIK